MDKPDEGKTPASDRSQDSASALEPWPEPVCGEALLESLRANYSRFVVLPRHADVLLAVWTLHTYVFSGFSFTPYVHITSPEPACGKSTLAELMNHLCYGPLLPGGLSAAAMYRLIDKFRPTLLIDEWDSLSLDTRHAAVNALNTGFKWDGTKIVCYGENHEPRKFHTFCPKAIFGLGNAKLPETTRSRCFTFTLHKKKPGESVEKLTRKFDGTEFRRQCLRWAQDFGDSLPGRQPQMPPGLDSRQEDISLPLLAIADACGGQWPEGVRASIAHFCDARNAEDGSASVEVLKEIRELFVELSADRLTSNQICTRLNGQMDHPWNEDGAAVDPKRLSIILAPYGIHPHNIKLPAKKVARGYYRQDFEDIFSRYIPAEGGSSRYPATKAENIDDFEGPHPLPPESGSGSGS